MAVGTTAALIGTGASLFSSLFGAKKASDTAKSAANTQAEATRRAADLQKEAADNSLAFSKDQYQQGKERIQPWQQSGTAALDQLRSFIESGGGGKYGKEFVATDDFQYEDFKPPTGVDFQNDPGYQFRIDQAQKGILRGAAAGGGAFTGGTLRRLGDVSQSVASDEYSKVFDRAAQTYASNFQKALTGYNTNFAKNKTAFDTGFNQFNTEQGNSFNRLSALSGQGLDAVNNLNAGGERLAGQNADILTSTANRVGALDMAGADATSAGQVASGNAWRNGIMSIADMFQQGGSGAGAVTSFQELLRNRRRAPTGSTIGNTGMSVYGARSGANSNPARSFNIDPSMYGG